MRLILVTEYSIWYILLCFILALAVSGLLYYKNKQHIELNRGQIYLLATLRFVIVFVLAVFLLKPAIKTIKKKFQKPLVVFAQDNSASIKYSKDSASLKDEYPDQVKKLIDGLQNDYRVLTYDFGSKISENLSFRFDDISTNFDGLFQTFQSDLFNENLEAVVIASDGISNKGGHPVYQAKQFSVPIYTVALGDTTPQVDISIQQVDFNREVFIGNTFPLFVNVKADDLGSLEGELQIWKENKIVAEQKYIVNSHHYFEKFVFQLEAKEKGIQNYTIKLSNVPAGDNLVNNQREIYVHVRDDVKKVLYLQEGWHPDASAFSQVLSNLPEFELEIANMNDFRGKIADYSLIILHQLPSKKHNSSRVLKSIIENNTPALFIIGENTNLQTLNELKWGLNIEQQNATTDDVRGYLNPDFTKFSFNFSVSDVLSLPPLNVPFGKYANVPASNIVFYQSLGDVVTQKPLMFLSETGAQKIGFITGIGIWSWRIYEYSVNYNHTITNEIITKLVHYLSAAPSKGRFVVEVPSLINGNSDIIFNARLYNASNELINTPQASLEIYSESGSSYPYTFNKDKLSYYLNAGEKPEGKYTYKAETQLGQETFEAQGAFVVRNTQMEQSILTANHNLLYRLSMATNGKMFYPNQLAQLQQEIKDNKGIEPAVLEQKTLTDLLNQRWIFMFLLFLASLEWFLRKFWGII